LASFTLFSSTSTPSSSLLVLKFQREKWGNSYWKFNESLLENENYIKLIENFWKGWQLEKLKYSLLDWWEIGKKKIKSLSITFSKNLAEDERKKLQTLRFLFRYEIQNVHVLQCINNYTQISITLCVQFSSK
jgi:hypothetical protein